MPRLRFSKVVWLVLLSQVLSLAVVSTALLELRNDLSEIPSGIDTSVSQPSPDTLTGPSTGDPNRQRPTLLPPRFIGETFQIVECIADALRARRLASRQLASSGAADEQHIDCDNPNPLESIQQPEKPDRPQGDK